VAVETASWVVPRERTLVPINSLAIS